MRAVLFDLDDTLLDYSGGVDECWTGACETVAPAAGVDAAALARALVDSRRWFWSDPDRHRRERVDMLRAWTNIVAHGLGTLGVDRADLARKVAEEFAARRRAAWRLFPDAPAVLDRLRAAGVPLGLVTNGDPAMQRDKVERFDLAPFFRVIVIEGEFGAGKPDAAVFRHALGALGTAPADATMIGDHLDWDVAGAQHVGALGVWIDRAGAGLPPGTRVTPDRIIRSLAEIREGG